MSEIGNIHKINDTVPRGLKDTPLHTVVTNFGDDARTRSPGKFSRSTNDGDFLVEINVGGRWKRLSLIDILYHLEEMTTEDPTFMRNKFGPMLVFLNNERLDFDDIQRLKGGPHDGALNIRTLLRGMVLYLVAEKRRTSLRGKSLSIKLMLGVIYDSWPAAAAVAQITIGEAGLKMLRAKYVPEPREADLMGGAL